MSATKRIGIFCGMYTLLLVAATLAHPSGSVAVLQGSAPFVPSPSDCTIEPRPIPSPPGEQPEASPSPSGQLQINGPLVPEDVVEEITAIVRGTIACTNAGDELRAFAYFTDEYVAQMFTGPDAVDYEGFLQILTTPVAALDESEQLAIIEISDVRLLRTGVIGAIVVTGDPADPFEDWLVFVETDDGWRITARFPVTTVYATPTA